MKGAGAKIVIALTALVIFGVGAVATYWIWPAGITELPLAAIKFGELLRALAAVVMGLATLWLSGIIFAVVFE